MEFEMTKQYHRPCNTQDEYVHGYVRKDGRVVRSHTRMGKQFTRNKWIGIPLKHAMKDPDFHKYNDWRIATGLKSLITN